MSTLDPLAALHRLSLALGTTLDRARECSAFLQWLDREVHPYVAFLFVADESREYLRLMGSLGLDARLDALLPVGLDPWAWLYESGVAIPMVNPSRRYALPLTIKGELLGILAVVSRRKRSLVEEQHFLDTATAYLASVLHAIERYESVERVVAERTEQLRVSEERFRRLAENAQDIIYRYEFVPRRGFTYVSPAATTITGYTPDEHYADPDLGIKIVHPDDRPLLEQYFKGEGIFGKPLALRWRRKDGRIIWTEQRTVPIRDEQGQLVAIEGIARDITQRKRRERELEALVRVSQAISHTLDLERLLESILQAAIQAVPAAEKGSILLADDRGNLVVRALSGYADPRVRTVRFLGHSGYAARAFREKRTLVVSDARADETIRYDGDIEEMLAIQSAIASPLAVQERVIGVISLDNATRTAAFTDEDVDVLTAIAGSAALAVENARLFEATKRHLQHVQGLLEVQRAITASLDLRLTLDIIVDRAMQILAADAVALLLYNPVAVSLEYASGRGFRTEAITKTRLGLGEGYAGRAALERRPVIIADVGERQDSGYPPLYTTEGFVSYVCVPLMARGNVQGVLEVFYRQSFTPDAEWLSLLEALAGQAAVAVDTIRLFENLQRSNVELQVAYEATIEGWARALELRDRETEGHTRRVAEVTVRLARVLGVGDAELIHIRRGALLHDIGKMGVPDDILRKPGPLTEEEWAVMRQHPHYAYTMLSSIASLRPALDIPYCHHERWDGTGYPRGLKGEEIPLAARIFAVVDVWDALCSDRPYRPAWPPDKALEYIREQAGKHFDPRVVEAFLAIITGGGNSR